MGILKDGPAGRWNYWSDGLYENEATDDDAFFRLSGWAPKHKVRGVETGKSVIYLHVYHRCVQNESRGEWSLPHTEEYKDFDFVRNNMCSSFDDHMRDGGSLRRAHTPLRLSNVF